eukprot:10762268-Alexandrium_andersonii.AAC.1
MPRCRCCSRSGAPASRRRGGAGGRVAGGPFAVTRPAYRPPAALRPSDAPFLRAATQASPP